ncbi:hypothetical protein M0D21_01625 [Aquimarina sp. D1M17]|uniref:hypothetical protein n=1 Tax=Aquimarina acroporae TaxID=2937283 RepID=UPI0020BE35F4|nr:hypothetical protein [Aquimarina acroporae]MCK8520244.1 hypothetical protein [Aquimarina acroporae]
MRFRFFLVFLIGVFGFVYGQVEKPSGLRIDKSDLKTDKYKLSGGIVDPNLENRFSLSRAPEDGSDYRKDKQPFSMKDENSLLQPEAKSTPKWFEKDREIKDEYKSDQYLGDFKNNGKFVSLVYRDHEYVDGDIVRILVNDDIIGARVFLTANYQGIRINLVKGFNKIDILALNQGESGPNTAEFQLYDELGNLITGNEWNLTTGVKATLIVVKE